MAEDKIILTEIDIDVDASVANISELKTKVADLSKALGEMKKDGKDTSAEYIKLSTDLKVTTAELKSNETMLVKVAQSNKANTGSIEQMRTKLAVVSKQWSALTEDERLNSDQGKKLTSQKKELTEAILKEEKATGDARRQVGFYERGMGLVNEQLTKIVPGLSSASGGAKTFGSVLKVALGPIGLIVAGIMALISILKTFEPLVEKIEQIIAGLTGSLKALKEGVLSVITGQKGLKDAFKDTASAMKESYTEAVKLKKAQQDLEDSTDDLRVSQAKYKTQIDELLIQSKNRTLSEEQRIKLIDEALKIEEKAFNERKGMVDEEVRQAFKKIEIGRDLSDEQIALLEKEGSAYARKLQQTKGITDEEITVLNDALVKQEELNQDSIALREKAMNRRDQLEDKAAEKEEKRKEARAKQEEEDQKAREKTAKEQEKELERLGKIAEANVKAMEDAVQATRTANEQMAAEKKDADQKEKDRLIEVAALNYENELAAAEGSIFAVLEVEKKGLDAKYKQETDYANKIGAKTTDIDKKYSNAKKAIHRAEQSAKFALASDFAQNIAQIAGEQSKVGKLAAAAATTISTFQGATAAFTGMITAVPGPVGIGLGIAAAAAAVASGLANVKKIYATKTGLPGDGGGGGGGSTPSVPATTAPDAIVRTSVNPEIGAGIVSRSTATADNGGFVLQPTIVEDEVTSKQKNSSSIKTTSVL